MKQVYVEWSDAVYNASWFTEEELDMWIERGSDWTICELGWLVRETKEYIVLAAGWKKGDEITPEQFVGVHKIPKGWIRKRKIAN